MIKLTRTWLAKNNALVQYLREIADSKPLSYEEEAELARRIQTGDEAARRELAQANLLFVVDVAKQYQNRGLTLAELISAGNVGLMIAVGRFDGARGYKFITYAVWWIRQTIQNALADDGRIVRLPVSLFKLIGKVVRASRKLEQASGEITSMEAVAAELGLTVEEIWDALSSEQCVRLDNPVWDEKDSVTFLDMLADESALPEDEYVLCQENKGALERLVDALDGREREIIRLYFGLDTGNFMNLREIGAEMSITHERVRQLKARALRKLRSPAFIASVFRPKKSAVK